MPTLSLRHGLPHLARGAALALFFVAPLFLSMTPLVAQPPDLRVQRLTPEGEVFSDLYAGGDGPPSISPDGRWVAYWFDGDLDDVFDLYVASRFGGDVRRISAPRPPGSDGPDSNTFRFTPDSRRVVFRIDQEDANRAEVWSVPVDGEAADAVKVSGSLAPGAEVNYGEVTADSARVVFGVRTASDYGLWSAPIDASAAPVRLHPAGSDDSNGITTRLAGSTVVLSFSGAAGQPSQLWTVPADGSTPAVRVSGDLVPGGDVNAFRVTPDNARLVYRADARFDGIDELWSVPIAGPPAAAVRLSPDPQPFSDVQTWQVNLEAGRVLFLVDSAVDEQYELWSAPLTGPSSSAERLNASLVANGDVLEFSSFGDWVVYLADDQIDEVPQAYVVPIDGPFTAAQRLHDSLPAGRLAAFPGFVPQPGPGSPEPLVLFASNLRDAGKADVFLQTIDAEDDPYPLFDELPAGIGYRSSCGAGGPPDYSAIVVCADLGVLDRIAVYRLDLEFGSTPVRLSSQFTQEDADATKIVVSPDGRWTAYRADEGVNERFDLHRVPTDGSAGPQRVHAIPPSSVYDVDEAAIWFTADSRGLLYAADHDVNSQLDLWISDSMIFGAGFELGHTGEWSSDAP